MSNPQQKKLVPISFQVQSYARIDKKYKADIDYPKNFDPADLLKELDPESGIALIFPPGFNFIVNEGDQGAGKTSWQTALRDAIGNIVAPNAINSIDQTKAFKFKFWGLDGNLYQARQTKSDFVLERIEADPDSGEVILNAKGKPVMSEMKSPRTFIKQVAGRAGISPMELRDMTPDEQIKWLRDLYSLDQEVLLKEVEIKKEYDSAYKARTAAGNEHARYKALTTGSPYYADQPTHQKYFSETSFEKLEQEFAETQTQYAEYTRNENLLKNAKETNLPIYEKAVTDADTAIADINEKIRLLQEQLVTAHNTKDEKVKALNEYKERIGKTEKWITDNKALKDNYDNLNTKIAEATEFKANKQQWELMLENQKQMNHFETEYQRLTGLIDGLVKAKAELTELFSPKVEGFEVCIPDETDKRHGLYYKGLPLIQLAESELWEMAVQLWTELSIYMVFVEHISELGSGAVEMFNKFIDRGGFVFATKMNRAEKNLKITFSDKIV